MVLPGRAWNLELSTTACLVIVFLIKAEVLKPISFARRFDKGELPGVRNLSPCRLARGQTAVEASGIGLR